MTIEEQNIRQTYVLAQMAAALEAGDQARGGDIFESGYYVDRAARLFDEATEWVRGAAR